MKKCPLTFTANIATIHELRSLALHTLVLLIGTNNLRAGDSPEEVRDGINSVIDEIRKSQPHIRIVLMAIFPRGEKAEDELRGKISATNLLLSNDSKKWQVDWIDIGAKLLEKDGSISKDIMDDYVHPTHKGYQIWGDALIEAGILAHSVARIPAPTISPVFSKGECAITYFSGLKTPSFKIVKQEFLVRLKQKLPEGSEGGICSMILRQTLQSQQRPVRCSVIQTK